MPHVPDRRYRGGTRIPAHHTTGVTVELKIDPGRCQGHGRCYDLAPELFGDDEEGYGTVLGDGHVPAGEQPDARLAAANCPEQAVLVGES